MEKIDRQIYLSRFVSKVTNHGLYLMLFKRPARQLKITTKEYITKLENIHIKDWEKTLREKAIVTHNRQEVMLKKLFRSLEDDF